MVHHRHQHVLVVGAAEEPARSGISAARSKLCARRLVRWPRPADSADHAAGVDDVPADVGLLGGNDDLLGDPVGRREQRAQALVAVHDVGQRRAQRLGIERARASRSATAML